MKKIWYYCNTHSTNIMFNIIILNSYIKHGYLKSSQIEKDLFHSLLEFEDQKLFSWFVKSQSTDIVYKKLIDKILMIVKKQL